MTLDRTPMTSLSHYLTEMEICGPHLDFVPPQAVLFPVLRRLAFLPWNQDMMLTTIERIEAPMLIALKLSQNIGPQVEHTQRPSVSLNRFPRLSHLDLLGFCICRILWLSDSFSCPNLLSLETFVYEPSPHCFPQISLALSLEHERPSCVATSIKVTSHVFERTIRLLLSAFQFPQLKLLRLQLNTSPIDDVLYTGWLRSLQLPSLQLLHIDRPGRSSAVYKGKQLDRIAIIPNYVDQVFWKAGGSVKAKIVFLTLQPPSSSELWNFPSAEVLVVQTSYGMHPHPVRLSVLLHSIFLEPESKQGLKQEPLSAASRVKKKIMQRRYNGAKEPVETLGSDRVKFPSLVTLVLADSVNRPDRVRHVEDELFHKLQEVVQYRKKAGYSIAEIRYTLPLKSEEGRQWFEGNGVKYTVEPQEDEYGDILQNRYILQYIS